MPYVGTVRHLFFNCCSYIYTFTSNVKYYYKHYGNRMTVLSTFSITVPLFCRTTRFSWNPRLFTGHRFDRGGSIRRSRPETTSDGGVGMGWWWLAGCLWWRWCWTSQKLTEFQPLILLWTLITLSCLDCVRWFRDFDLSHQPEQDIDLRAKDIKNPGYWRNEIACVLENKHVLAVCMFLCSVWHWYSCTKLKTDWHIMFPYIPDLLSHFFVRNSVFSAAAGRERPERPATLPVSTPTSRLTKPTCASAAHADAGRWWYTGRGKPARNQQGTSFCKNFPF